MSRATIKLKIFFSFGGEERGEGMRYLND